MRDSPTYDECFRHHPPSLRLSWDATSNGESVAAGSLLVELQVCCPMSTKVKGHPFEVMFEIGGVPGAVLSDQLKSLDWKIRNAKKKAVAPTSVMADVRAKIKALLAIA